MKYDDYHFEFGELEICCIKESLSVSNKRQQE